MVTEFVNKWFEHFHAHPEVSWKEHETTKTLAAIMDDLDVTYRTFDDVTGLIAEIGEGDDVIAVRADIDALWQEVDGKYRANHSCGHDANISMVLGALYLLKQQKLSKRVRFIFQPAEEKGNGSLEMVRHGALRHVSQLYGVHLRPIEELKRGQYAAAIEHGAAVFLTGKVLGVDAHGARPHQGKNAIDVVMAIHQALKTIYLSPFSPHSAKLTNVHAGSDSLNIIPGTATFSIDARAAQNRDLRAIQQRVEHILEQMQVLHDVTIEWEWNDFTPGAEVGAEAKQIAYDVLCETVGSEQVVESIVTSGSDDFHFYTVEKPDLQATMIGIGANLSPGLHHPYMDFEHDVLPEAAELLAKILKRATEKR